MEGRLEMTFIGDEIMARDPAIAVAAVSHLRGQGVNDLVAEFARTLMERGVRVRGLIQRRAPEQRGCAGDLFLVDLSTGQDFRISQNLGSESESCNVDSAAIAEASAVLRRAMAERIDLLIINKFGKLESEEGGGLTHEMVSAVAAGIPVLTTVREDRLDRWSELMGDFSVLLRPEWAEMEAWWRWCQRRRQNMPEDGVKVCQSG
jgi:nucleoside-triphosphatase THEP1